jgi:hypothetical protein
MATSLQRTEHYGRDGCRARLPGTGRSRSPPHAPVRRLHDRSGLLLAPRLIFPGQT